MQILKKIGSFLDKIDLALVKKSSTEVDDHMLVITFSVNQGPFAGLENDSMFANVFSFEEALEELIKTIPGGMLDGDGFSLESGSPEECSIYLFALDADAALKLVSPLLRSKGYGPYAIKIYYGNVVLHPDLEPVEFTFE